MTIVFCIMDHTPSGGTERTLSLQANHFAAGGHDVHIVTTEVSARPEPTYPFAPAIHLHNLDIRYREVDGGRTPSKILTRMRKGRLHRSRLFALLQELRPQISVSLFEHEASFLYRSPDASRKVMQYHFSRYSRDIENRQLPFLPRLFDRFKERRKQRCIRHYDAFVVLTHQDAALWPKMQHLHVIPNALSFRSDRCSDCLSHTVMTVGRLVPQKGYPHLLRAWAEVLPSHPDWQLHIYGAGALLEQLTKQISDLDISRSVHIFPPTPHIVDRYQQASIFALTSQYEGFGMVLAEAMVCGVPCVSFDAPCGPSEIICDGEDGYIVPVGDEQAFAQRLSHLMDNTELRQEMGRRARTNIQRFSPEVVMMQWEQLYEQLLTEKKK